MDNLKFNTLNALVENISELTLFDYVKIIGLTLSIVASILSLMYACRQPGGTVTVVNPPPVYESINMTGTHKHKHQRQVANYDGNGDEEYTEEM